MKSTKHIVLCLIFLNFISCQKEIVKPCSSKNNQYNNEISPESSSLMLEDVQDKSSKTRVPQKSVVPNIGTSSSSENDGDDGSNDGSGITDPNNDPDSNKKKGGKL
jgi:hypothetical protein